ncbi:MAG TPA: family 16 glycoside hydrolase [Vicinamibacteria bacterium]|nr:family 16 glycoside hydrolase [Vicinamibacteria bacterium]
MTRLLSLAAAGIVSLPLAAAAQPRAYPLESAQGLRLVNVTAEPATLQGKKGLRLAAVPGQGAVETLARIEGVTFSSGTIEAEIAGVPAPDAPEGARGFVGIAFRLQDDGKTYDAFYLRPTNGRAEDQERRNHSAQYIAHPDWPWFRLRKETPSRYEAYVDLVPGEWTKVRIEVRSERARLYVNGNPQPTLIVNDVKSGASGKGAVALWLDIGTIAHFRNLTISPDGQ